MHIALPIFGQESPERVATWTVEVGFKGTRRGYYISDDETLRPKEYVVVEVERGEDLGRIVSVGGAAARKCSSCNKKGDGESTDNTPTARVLRRADPEEVHKLLVQRADEERVRRKVREMVEQHALKMKISEAEWQWDQNKLIIYFTAERRVDFRQLVRDLARTFRTRIELKQIGVRDEAALLGGIGRCGRELCCATWLREIKPISLQLAKDQNLSLNPQQISGTCGRLMCCLTYEHDAYLQARKKFPREGKLMRTAQGQEKVIAVDIWHETVTLLDENRQRRVIKLSELKAETAAQASSGRERGPAEREASSPEEPRVEPQTNGAPPSSRKPRRRPERR
ncbi:MAG TPA: regulatory iron-sulfur-containing complex subunit RicT [Longimicrobiaceae bacterium]|nr:regulatory iron-sulfur-containing complex subunit RicT [Longimicrobiaceae bacterium]